MLFMNKNYLEDFHILSWLSLIVGIVYVIFGLVEILSIFGFIPVVEFIAPDPLAGFVLIVIGGIYVNGFHSLRVGDKRALGFPLVASILSGAFAALFLLVLIADAIEAYIICNEEFVGWVWYHDLRPEIYLFLLTLPIILILWKLILKEKIIQIT